MKRLSFYLVFGFSLMLCVGCNEPDSYYRLDEYTTSIGFFREGSYWIYSCEAMNATDTVTVVNYEVTQTGDHMDSHMIYRDIMTITLQSSYWDCEINNTIKVDYLGDLYTREYAKGINGSSRDFSFTIKNEEIVPGGGKVAYHLDGYALNGEIVEELVAYSYSSDTLNYKYYFAEYYGIVMMELPAGASSNLWKLIDCKIVK